MQKFQTSVAWDEPQVSVGGLLSLGKYRQNLARPNFVREYEYYVHMIEEAVTEEKL